MGSTSAQQSAKSKHSGASTAVILSKYHHDDVSAVTGGNHQREGNLDRPTCDVGTADADGCVEMDGASEGALVGQMDTLTHGDDE